MKQSLLIGIFTLLIFLNSNFSQSYINTRNLPTPDCSGKSTLWNEFNENKTILLVIPDNPSDLTEFNRMSSYVKASYADSLIKKESELTDEDFNNALKIYGTIKDFINWDKFGLPFKKVTNGFLFNDKEYKNNSDGFFFISKDRMVYSGNSLEPIWKQQTTMVSYYKYIIFKDGLLDKLCISDSVIIDVAGIRESNYNNSSTKYYSLFIDKKLNDIYISDSIVIDICDKLKLDLPEFRINAFMHNDPNAARLFSNFYFLIGCDTLEPTMKFGTVQIDGIHTTGDDIGFVKHETFHYLWEKLVGHNPNGNEFLNEGIQKYYEFLKDTSVLSYSIKIQQKHLDYDLTNLVMKGDGQTFWNAPKENNYTIAYELSGLFVKYLIDNWGLDAFKELFIQKDLSQAYKVLYNLQDAEVIESYNDWITNIISKLP